jgi:hypothetical protein
MNQSIFRFIVGLTVGTCVLAAALFADTRIEGGSGGGAGSVGPAGPAGTNGVDLTAATNFALGSVSGGVTANFSNSPLQSMVLTNDATLLLPINGRATSRLELWITAGGGGRSLALTNAIVIPSDSAFTSPKTLTSNKTYIVLLRSPNGTNWWLSSLVGGF